jgi:hypothetical protein
MAIRNFAKSFGEFYETIYLPDHAAPLNRRVYFYRLSSLWKRSRQDFIDRTQR